MKFSTLKKFMAGGLVLALLLVIGGCHYQSSDGYRRYGYGDRRYGYSGYGGRYDAYREGWRDGRAYERRNEDWRDGRYDRWGYSRYRW